MAAQRGALLAGLLGLAESQIVTADGMRLRFAAGGGTLLAIAQAIDAERRWCSFVRFTVTVEPDEGPIVLELTGGRDRPRSRH